MRLDNKIKNMQVFEYWWWVVNRGLKIRHPSPEVYWDSERYIEKVKHIIKEEEKFRRNCYVIMTVRAGQFPHR